MVAKAKLMIFSDALFSLGLYVIKKTNEGALPQLKTASENISSIGFSVSTLLNFLEGSGNFGGF